MQTIYKPDNLFYYFIIRQHHVDAFRLIVCLRHTVDYRSGFILSKNNSFYCLDALAKRHRSRERMSQEGLLVQIEGSPHAWLEDRGPELSLFAALDDATGKVLGATFRYQEDPWRI